MRQLQLIIAVSLAFVLSTLSHAQICAEETGSPYIAYDIISDPYAAQHLTGNHTFNGGVTEQCTYTSIGNTYCQTVATATPYGVVTDTGLLSTVPLGYHVAQTAIAVGSQTNPNGGAQANGTSASAVMWCLSRSCAIVVSASPVSFPSGSVWTTSQTAGPVCPAVLDAPGGGYGGGGGCNLSGGSDVYCACCLCLPGDPGCNGSPIIVDTTGRGFHLTSAAAGVMFDIAGDGHPVRIAWTTPGSGNAFLALESSSLSSSRA